MNYYQTKLRVQDIIKSRLQATKEYEKKHLVFQMIDKYPVSEKAVLRYIEQLKGVDIIKEIDGVLLWND